MSALDHRIIVRQVLDCGVVDDLAGGGQDTEGAARIAAPHLSRGGLMPRPADGDGPAPAEDAHVRLEA
jgi:hypothetical protein